jgi:hypothetical protein
MTRVIVKTKFNINDKIFVLKKQSTILMNCALQGGVN